MQAMTISRGIPGPTHPPSLEEVTPMADGVADTETSVVCPWCSERMDLALDPGGGALQDYVEDCQVCCRPVQLAVRYADDGRATVEADRED